MDAKELFQNQVLEDIKAIAEELSRIQSFSGLLAHQQKIQNLYEKYIFLKQFNNSKYQYALDDSEINEIMNEVSRGDSFTDKSFDDTALIQGLEELEDLEEEIQLQNIQSNDNDQEDMNPVIEETLEAVQLKDTEGEAAEKEENGFEEEDKEEARKEKLSPLNIEIAEIKPTVKDKKLTPVILDFNDSIAFISQLFNGSKTDMDKEFEELNKTHTLEEAKKWVEDMFHKYDWRDKEEYVERLSALIVRRFEI